MAADILLYDANEVPVGEDQRQHVELARDIAERFNNLYGPTFVVPKATLPVVGARVMNLQDPTSKMSKSDDDQSGNVLLTDTPDEIRKKFKRAVTDSHNEVKAGDDRAALTNLLSIYSAVTDRPVADIEADYAGKGYGDFKNDLAEAVVAHIHPIQQRHAELMADERKLLAILEDGREKAAAIADEKLDQVKQTLGLL
jgi:tryptophanyl-tRNA synthetase